MWVSRCYVVPIIAPFLKPHQSPSCFAASAGHDLQAQLLHIPTMGAQVGQQSRLQLAQFSAGSIAGHQHTPGLTVDGAGFEAVAQPRGQQRDNCCQTAHRILAQSPQPGQAGLRPSGLLGGNRFWTLFHDVIIQPVSAKMPGYFKGTLHLLGRPCPRD